MKTTVLITGGAGFIGSVLCESLLDSGFRVEVVDNLSMGEARLYHLAHHPDFFFTRGDCRDESLMKKKIAKADVIIPLAAVVGAPACDQDPWMAESVNLEAVRLVQKLCSTTQRILYPNTNSGYGTGTGEVNCDENTPLEPISLYGRTKTAAENELLQTGNAVVFRLATVFGMSPRPRFDLLVNNFVYLAMTQGYVILFEKDFKRNYVHIRDVADCFVFAINNYEKMKGQPFNLGLDEANLSKEELALLIKKLIPSFHIHASEIGSDPDKRNYIVSNQKLSQAGFTASRSLELGIREVMQGCQMLGREFCKNV